jgi:RNA polymerase sigma-70 factor (ECF subfamily)
MMSRSVFAAIPKKMDMNSSALDWHDDDAARQLVENLRPRLMNEIQRRLGDYLRRRIDEEDILQSVFCSFFRRARDGTVQFDHSTALCNFLRTLVETKVCRAAIHHTRKCRDVRSVAGISVEEIDPGDDDWEQQLSQVEEIVEEMRLVVDRLSERDAEFFRRRFIEGHTLGKIAKDTQWSVSTIRRVLTEVQRKIRERAEKNLL